MFTWSEEQPAFKPAELVPTKWGGHYYKAPNGDVYPSVTTMKNKLWPFEGSPAQRGWFRKLGGEEVGKTAGEYARSKGTWLHRVVELFLRNEDQSKHEIPNDVQQLFGNLSLSYLPHINNIIGCEIPVYSYKMRLAGMIDCIAQYYGTPSIIDFKTSVKAKAESSEQVQGYYFQLATYAKIWNELTGQNIDQLVILMTCATGERQEFIGSLSDHESKIDDALIRFEGLR